MPTPNTSPFEDTLTIEHQGLTWKIQVAPAEAGEQLGPWLPPMDTDNDPATPEVLTLVNAFSEQGMDNTRLMASDKSPLAAWALEARIGGHDDWYIPTIAELEEIYRHYGLNSDVPQAYRFSPGWYWSSTEVSEAEAMGQGFHRGGSKLATGKGWEGRVRLVRRS